MDDGQICYAIETLTKDGYQRNFAAGIQTTGIFGLFLQTVSFRQAKSIAVTRYGHWHEADAEEFLGGGYEPIRDERQPKTFHYRP